AQSVVVARVDGPVTPQANRPREARQPVRTGRSGKGCGNSFPPFDGHRHTPHPNLPPQGGREPEKPSPLVGEGWVGGRGKTKARRLPGSFATRREGSRPGPPALKTLTTWTPGRPEKFPGDRDATARPFPDDSPGTRRVV